MATNPKKPRYVFNPPADRLKGLQDKARALHDDAMEFLIDLNAAGRQQQARLSTEDIVFTEDGLNYSGAHPEFAPAAVDLAAFGQSMQGITDLLSVSRTVQELARFMDHSEMVMRTDAYADARGYYKGAKVAAELGSPGAEPVALALGKAFEQRRPSPAPAPGAATPAAASAGTEDLPAK